MEPRAVLTALRRGEVPAAEDLRAFARGLATGEVSDAQAGAFAMAVCLRGLGPAGRAALTQGMRDSGTVLRWDLPGPVLDKHSTGGGGDCVSLVLAPLLAACGVYVPMISGRGLGHTGGTLDKLAAIPGYDGAPDAARLRWVVAEAGCAIVSASDEIAPADRRLYALRDVSGTVESVDLICASILSKKLAAGLEGLVLDVKCGSGAFMKTQVEAGALARALVETAEAADCPTVALVTGMDQPLAPSLGNALEVAEALAVLTGAARGPLCDLSLALGEALLARAGIADGAARLRAALESGAAAERMGRMVAGLGGPADLLDRAARHLPQAPVRRDVPAPEAGHVAVIDGEALGLAVVRLGGGRLQKEDRIDPAVGLAGMVRLGQKLDRGAPLAVVHAATPEAAERAVREVQAAVTLGPAPEPLPLVLERIG